VTAFQRSPAQCSARKFGLQTRVWCFNLLLATYPSCRRRSNDFPYSRHHRVTYSWASESTRVAQEWWQTGIQRKPADMLILYPSHPKDDRPNMHSLHHRRQNFLHRFMTPSPRQETPGTPTTIPDRSRYTSTEATPLPP
jgi:hypothetical protein